jgi:hypothetical protein
MGSGKLIKLAIKKYGIENFSKEILFFCDSEEEMNRKEAELVVLSETTYNLCPGGVGGFTYINQNCHNNKGNHRRTGNYGFVIRPTVFDSEKISQRLKEYYQRCGSHWTGRTHRESSKNKMRNHRRQDGPKNSQWGTCWVTDGKTSKKIPRTELEDYLHKGFSKGRTM